MMRLLFITRNFPPQTGGMEQYCWNLYRKLKERTDTELLANTGGKRLLPFFLLRVFVMIVFRGYRFSHIHLGDGVLAIVGVWAKLFSKARITITIHALDVTYNNRFYQWLIRCCLKRLDGVVCVSDFTRRECLARGVAADRCRVIPNGLDLDDMPVADNELVSRLVAQYKLDGKKVLLSVGRLIRRKGMHWFIEEILLALPVDYVLLIAGDGPERTAIEAAIADRQLSSRAFLLGKVDAPTKACLYSLADLFVMPNIQIGGDSEGFGISIIEAGFYGTACIGTRLQGIPDAVVEGKTGVLVNSGDTAGFRQAILDARFERSKVSETVRQHFDWSRLIDDYMDFLQ
jgi:glycosyltransferase involved in cell wall biosynthesis